MLPRRSGQLPQHAAVSRTIEGLAVEADHQAHSHCPKLAAVECADEICFTEASKKPTKPAKD